MVGYLAFIHSFSHSRCISGLCLRPRKMTLWFSAPGFWWAQISICVCMNVKWASQGARVVKNPSAKAGDIREVGSMLGWGRSPGEGNGNPLQYSCLENPMERGACWATVHGVTQSQTRLKWLSMHMNVKYIQAWENCLFSNGYLRDG